MGWDGLAETVIYRIFFYVNKAGNGQLQLREIKRSNLIASLQQVDEEEDINKVLRWVLPPWFSSPETKWMEARFTTCHCLCYYLQVSWISFFGALRYNEYLLVMTDTSHMSTSMSFTASSGNLIQIMTFWLIRMTYCDMETMLSHTALLSVFFHR